MGLLGDLYSYIDTKKRQARGLLNDPLGELAAGVKRFGNDWNDTLNLQANAYPMPGDKTVLNSPEQIAAFRRQLADKGANMGMAAMTAFKYPQDEALKTAQRNAAKPVSEGGLGLPKNNTPEMRAKAMGFEDGWMHGTPNDFRAYDVKAPRTGDGDLYGSGMSLGRNADDAAYYADGGQIMPVMTRGKAYKHDAAASYVSKELEKSLKRKNVDLIDAVIGGDVVERVAINPSAARSRFAAFDPARINENDLLGRADPALLGLLGIGSGAYYLNDK
jgi:hypothetical protein